MKADRNISPLALCLYCLLTMAVPLLMDADNRARQLVETAEQAAGVVQQAGRLSGLAVMNTWQRQLIDALSAEYMLAATSAPGTWTHEPTAKIIQKEEPDTDVFDDEDEPDPVVVNSTLPQTQQTVEPAPDVSAVAADDTAPTLPAAESETPPEPAAAVAVADASAPVTEPADGTPAPVAEPEVAEDIPGSAAEPVADASQPSPAAETDTPLAAESAAAPIAEETSQEPPSVAAVDERPVNCRIMMVGDSMMEDFGPTLHREMRSVHGLEFVLTAKFSTGLCVTKTFNWRKHFEAAVEEHTPDIVIFFIGANDAMPMHAKGVMVMPGAPEWHEEYVRRAMKMTRIALRKHALVMWVGLPIMGDKYAAHLHGTTEAIREAAERSGVPYVDTEPVLADEKGQFRSFGPNAAGKEVRLRRKDKVHMTPDGNLLLVRHAKPTVLQLLSRFRELHPERILTGIDTQTPYQAPLKVTIKYEPPKRKK